MYSRLNNSVHNTDKYHQPYIIFNSNLTKETNTFGTSELDCKHVSPCLFSSVAGVLSEVLHPQHSLPEHSFCVLCGEVCRNSQSKECSEPCSNFTPELHPGRAHRTVQQRFQLTAWKKRTFWPVLFGPHHCLLWVSVQASQSCVQQRYIIATKQTELSLFSWCEVTESLINFANNKGRNVHRAALQFVESSRILTDDFLSGEVPWRSWWTFVQDGCQDSNRLYEKWWGSNVSDNLKRPMSSANYGEHQGNQMCSGLLFIAFLRKRCHRVKLFLFSGILLRLRSQEHSRITQIQS